MEFALIGYLAIIVAVVGAVLAGIFFFLMVSFEPRRKGKRRKIE